MVRSNGSHSQKQREGTQLNRYVQRENRPLPTTDTTLGKLAGAKFFLLLDANSGFCQIKLSEKSRPVTTFITPYIETLLVQRPSFWH